MTHSSGSADRILSAQIGLISAPDWGWMILVGSLSVIGFWSQTASLQWIDASTLSSLKSLEILFAYLVQIIVMQQNPNSIALLGSILFTSIFICILWNRFFTRMENHLFRATMILPFCSGRISRHPGYVVNPDDCRDNNVTAATIHVTATTIFKLSDNFKF